VEAGRYLSGKARGLGVRALVVGASGGIGQALVTALQARGEVVGLSRQRDGLEVTDEASVARVMGALDGVFDLVIVATGALVLDGQGPEKTLKAVTAEGLARSFAVNAIGPALVMKHALRLMPRDRIARLAVLSARVGSIGDNGLGGWYGYRAAKAALNQLVHTAAIEASRTIRSRCWWPCIRGRWRRGWRRRSGRGIRRFRLPRRRGTFWRCWTGCGLPIPAGSSTGRARSCHGEAGPCPW
jgi:NAD(P)-dependent dehydrogenase (short-subunit alcohol dehydrogenase family)